MNPIEPLQYMGVGMLGMFSKDDTSLPQLIVALIILTAFVISCWVPIQDDGMKTLLVGAMGIILGAYFNHQGHKVTT